jgi:hyperosmotically inducible protein
MNKKISIRNKLPGSLISIGLVFCLGVGTAVADNNDVSPPQPHSDGIGATISDTAITAKVKAKLMEDHRLKKSDISVITTNGVVTLNGTANSAKAKTEAERVAKSIEGVKSVDNTLKVPGDNKRVTKAERAVSDSWITTKVKSEILANSASKGFKVSVKTKHGVVILKGTLANLDAIDHVKDIAAKVKGVKSVDTKALTIKDN